MGNAIVNGNVHSVEDIVDILSRLRKELVAFKNYIRHLKWCFSRKKLKILKTKGTVLCLDNVLLM